MQDTRDAVVEAATAGALDRRLAALERRVSARLITSCTSVLSGIVSDMFCMFRFSLNVETSCP